VVVEEEVLLYQGVQLVHQVDQVEEAVEEYQVQQDQVEQETHLQLVHHKEIQVDKEYLVLMVTAVAAVAVQVQQEVSLVQVEVLEVQEE
jgi:hypothetical protein